MNEEPLHEVFKQSPILVDEEFTLEEEGLVRNLHFFSFNSQMSKWEESEVVFEDCGDNCSECGDNCGECGDDCW